MRPDRTPRHAAPKAGAPRHARVGPRSTGMKRRRRRVLIVASLILSLAGALTLSAKALDLLPGETVSPPPALLGAWVKGESRQPASQLAATRQLEASIGRKLAIGHSFVPWGRSLGSLPAAHLADGRTPLISFGRGGDLGKVAAGDEDAYLTSLAREVRALGGRCCSATPGPLDSMVPVWSWR